MKRTGTVLAVFALLAFADPVAAQRQRASPHETTTSTIGAAKVEITYGRPFKKGRDVWNGPVTQAPSKEIWRMGADEATTLKTSAPLTFGSVNVPAGEYTLFMASNASGAKQLVINRQTGQWGLKHDPAQDLGRVDLKEEKLTAPVEQLTIAVEPQGNNGMLRVSWDNRAYSTTFTAGK
ncbi:MAG TPA: DUF2911 domain-containing protein [Vicinamibacterales bacterium]|nr:DUF2911 domain-containing protein [Vicinamibacterales bacterium]